MGSFPGKMGPAAGRYGSINIGVIKMNKEEFYKKYAGKYHIVQFVIMGNDNSAAYIEGWKDKSLYLFYEITEDGQFGMTARSGEVEKRYQYYLNPEEMKYYTQANFSGTGVPFTIENGVFREETPDHLMVFELTSELD